MDDFLDKMPNWLRYILAIPIALIAVILGYYIFYWSNLWVASPDSLMIIFCTFIYQNGLNVFVLIATMNYILPKHQIKFTLTISIIYCAIGFVGLGMVLLMGEITIPYIVGFITTLISFIISCVFTFKEYYRQVVVNNIITKDDLDLILKDNTKLSNIISGKEKINAPYLINRQNPYTGKIIYSDKDSIEYLRMFQLDFNGLNPLEVLKK